MCDVAIIGSGPYGLGLAAHLRARGVDFRIFGSPMRTWINHMPKGMHLKSEGFASWLYDPGCTFTLEDYCREQGLPYAHRNLPVPLETFWAYGLEFQKRFVPNLEDQWVTGLRREGSGFQLTLGNGEQFQARRVVLAVGLTYFDYTLPVLASLPPEYATHSSRHSNLEHFRGREVAIVGAGSSAVDIAALLHEQGAKVQVIARGPRIRFHDPPDPNPPTWLDDLRSPFTGIGPGWKLYLCANLPLLFRMMPDSFRLEKVKKLLGPAPCWFTKEQVVGKVDFQLNSTVTGARVDAGRVKLEIAGSDGSSRTVTADHVISATGYKADLRRLAFLDSGLLAQIKSLENTPRLSSNFECTVPDLYFVGITAANTFGPLLRFAFGAGFAAPRLANHLARSAARKPAHPLVAPSVPPARPRETSEPVTR